MTPLPRRRAGTRPSRRGFTLPELLISITIFALIMGAVMYSFQQNMDAMRRGDEEMFLQSEAAKVLTDIYLELTGINPTATIDKENDLWIAGEKGGEIVPDALKFDDFDDRKTKGFDTLSFFQTDRETLTGKTIVSYYLRPDPILPKTFEPNRDKSGFTLIKKKGETERVLSENVVRCDFTPVDNATKGVLVDGEVAIRAKKGGKVKAYPFRFLVRLESPYLTLRQ